MGDTQRQLHSFLARWLFYVHVLVVMCLIVGMNFPLSPETVGAPLFLLSTVLPLVILIVAIREQLSWFKIATITGLSMVLTIPSFYALLPSVM